MFLNLDLSSRRVQLAIRFFTYGVMAVSTILLSILAIFYAMGYRFNQNNLGFEQGGIIEFRTEPSNARVFVDGNATDKQTPSRAYVSQGNHALSMQLDGYRPWAKNVSILPGQLLWIDYVRFVPQTITTVPVKEFSSLASTLPSPNGRWIFLQENPTLPTLTLADINNEKSPTFTNFTLPDAALTKKDGKTGTLTLVEWDQDSRYVLARHDLDEIHEVLRLDREQPEATVNLSKQFALNLGAVHFAGNSGNVVFAQVADTLRRLDVSGNSAAPPVIAGLTQFAVYGGDTVAFAAMRGQDQVIGVYQGGKETLVQTTTPDKKVLLALTEYFRHQYVAFSLGDGQITVVTDPTNKQSNTVQFTQAAPASWLQFSPKGRFILAGGPGAWGGYDLEVGTSFVAPGSQERSPKWLDDFHLWVDTGDTLKITDFDGQNSQDITSVAPGFAAVLSPNEKAVLSVSKTPTGFSLQTSGLVN